MDEVPKTVTNISWFEGEVITVDFDRSVKFDPKQYSELTKLGRWIDSDDLSKFYLVRKSDSVFPDDVINKVLGKLSLNGYELIHRYVAYAQNKIPTNYGSWSEFAFYTNVTKSSSQIFSKNEIVSSAVI